MDDYALILRKHNPLATQRIDTFPRSGFRMSSINPLDLPELLIAILEYLQPHPSSLCSAIRVNRVWYEAGTDILWQNIEDIKALVAVSADRRSKYSSKIRYLESFRPGPHHDFKDLDFSRLKSFTEYAGSLRIPLVLDQYIQPNLEEFACHMGPIPKETFDRLFRICPRLRAFSIDRPGRGIYDATNFFEPIRSCPSLRSFDFMYDMSPICTDDRLVEISKRKNLESLSLGWWLKRQTIETVFSPDPSSFRSLESLKVSLKSRDVSIFVQSIRALPITELRLRIGGNDEAVLHHLARLRNLITLDVIHSSETRHSLADLQTLQELSRLEVLSLGRPEGVTLVEPDDHLGDFTDDTFGTFISHFPLLRKLSLNFHCDISIAALRSIAKSCPLLQELALYPTQSWDMPALYELPAPTFPVLKSLSLDTTILEDDIRQGIPFPQTTLRYMLTYGSFQTCRCGGSSTVHAATYATAN